MSKRRTSRHVISLVVLLLILIAVMGGIYYIGMRHFRTHFLPGTTVNGIAAGDKTADEVGYAIQDKIREYNLTVRERGGETELITGEQLYMQYVDDGSIDKLLAEQDSKMWIFSFSGKKALSVSTGFTYDEEAVDDIMDQMRCFDEASLVQPVDAHIDDSGATYTVVEEVEGNVLDREKTREVLVKAIQSGQAEVDLEAEGVYLEPAVRADDAGLNEKVEALNKLCSARVTYDFADREKVVDGALIREWIVDNGDGTFALDENRVKDWVVQMARETDTFGLSHEFTTHDGTKITLEGGGDYGWLIGRDDTTAQLIAAIQAGEETTLEPIYRYKGVQRETDDIGDTYVEICIAEQKMWCFDKGELVVETDVVTGNESRRLYTPSGHVWAVDAKKSPAHFGSFNVDVQYWLPFTGNVGIHDASWRSNYGGSIFKTGGSHGCVNTPKEAAEKIYKVINIGDPIIVYYSKDQIVGPSAEGELHAG